MGAPDIAPLRIGEPGRGDKLRLPGPTALLITEGMAAVPPFVLSDARWLGHRYVEEADAYRFVFVPRADHAQIPFLTDDCLGERSAALDLPVDAVLAGCPDGPLHFVFHSAFCGSTMLTRAFDRPGTAMGLSEPVVLNDVVGFRKRGAPSSAVARMAHGALRLLGRPFAEGEAVLVKPSNLANGYAELFLALQPQARAVFLYAPLETFLISVARKGLACRLWVRELAESFLREGLFAPLGLDAAALFRQADLQIAASGWLAQHHLFAALAAKVGPARLRSLDADRMTADPAAALAAVGEHYGFGLDADAVAEIAAGPTFSRHSKSGAAFTAADRRTQYAAVRAAYGEEIDAVMAWSVKLAEAAGINFEGPAPLLQSS